MTMLRMLRLGASSLALICLLGQVNSVGAQPCSARQCPGIGLAYPGGVNDNFAPPEDPASPRPAFLTFAINAGAGITDFDGNDIDEWFLHSFTGLPNTICSATLTIRLKPLGSSNNDGIAFQFDENTNTFGWSEVIQTVAGVNWAAPQPAVDLTFDLGCLPPDGFGRTSVLAQVNATGHLDIRVQDDTSVDFISLEICYDCPTPTKSTTWGGIKARHITSE